jgi:hypothetical protein
VIALHGWLFDDAIIGERLSTYNYSPIPHIRRAFPANVSSCIRGGKNLEKNYWYQYGHTL